MAPKPPPRDGLLDPGLAIDLRHHEAPVTPKRGARNVLVTSALPYVNNVPHLGNIIGCVLSADVYARYCRLRGYTTLYICGTDEYGTATETKALEEKMTCQALCDKYHAVHKAVYDWFCIDFDYFGRTSMPKQTAIAQQIFARLNEKGLVHERTITQLYSEKGKRFLADRYVEGTCPLCGYEDARGDQCDNCQQLLNATDLINPRSKVDGSRPVLRETNHMFLDLPALQDRCGAWVEAAAARGGWTDNAVAATRALLRAGLRERCITRDLEWGTPVPLPHMAHKVFYVWFDAPIGYLSITANYTDAWEQWWRNPRDVRLVQFMGKDNTPFHTVIFPCSLLGTGETWTMLDQLSTTEYLNYEDGKFSKSRNVGVFGNNVMESGIPVEVWRYYLLAVRPEASDASFNWGEFIVRNNSELLSNLGNFVNRVLKFAQAKYDGRVPEGAYGAGWGAAEDALVADVAPLLQRYLSQMEATRLRGALEAAMRVSGRGNEYLQHCKIDNTLFTQQRARCDAVVGVAINLAYLLSSLIEPFMPTTADALRAQLRLPRRRITETWTGREIAPGHVLGKPAHLFSRIDPAKEAEFRAKYGGGSGPAGGDGSGAGGAKKGGRAGSAGAGKKGQKKAGAAAAGLNAIPAGVTRTPEMEAVEAGIKAQGQIVRELKAAPQASSPADLSAALDKLLELKRELARLVAAAPVAETVCEATADLFQFSNESYAFVPVVSKAAVSLVRDPGQSPVFRLVVRRPGSPSKPGALVLEQKVEQRMNVAFNHSTQHQTWNQYGEPSDSAVTSWRLHFPAGNDGQRVFAQYMAAFTAALYDTLNVGGFSDISTTDQGYIRSAYDDPDVEMADADSFVSAEAHSSDEESAPDSPGPQSYAVDPAPPRDLGNAPAKNSLLLVGTAGSERDRRQYVARGSRIGVFKQADDGEPGLEYVATVAAPLAPSQAMLHESDRTMLMMAADDPHRVKRFDIEYGRVVQDILVDEDIALKQILPKSKYESQRDTPEFLGIARNSTFAIDPRIGSPSKRDPETTKTYATKTAFSHAASTANGQLVVASERGEIRFYSRLAQNAKTLLPGLGDPIKGIDVTARGDRVVATCRDYLLLISTEHPTDPTTTIFAKPAPADHKPRPIRLRLRPEHVAAMGVPVDFTVARFVTTADGDRSEALRVVTSSGPYVITWNLGALASNRLYDYQIKRYDDQIVADNFVFDQRNNIVVALPDELALTTSRQLKSPKKHQLLS